MISRKRRLSRLLMLMTRNIAKLIIASRYSATNIGLRVLEDIG